MKLGDIVILSFPFTNLTTAKARPAVVVAQTPDFNDLIVCLITSVIPQVIHPLHLLLTPNPTNNLRAKSLIKIYRIATVEINRVSAVIGRLETSEIDSFKQKFKSLVDTEMQP